MKMQHVVLALAVLAAIMVALWSAMNPPTVTPAANAVPTPSPASPLDGVALPPLPRTGGHAPATGAPDPGEPPAEIPLWEKQIDDFLKANVSESQTARTLINAMPGMPEEGQVEATHHIANLLDDKDYNLVLPILLNPGAPEEVLSILFTDLMNRSDAVKLRTFLEVAKLPSHPFHQEALSNLGIYLDGDQGGDPARLSAAVDKYLQDNPPEPQPEAQP